MFLVITRNSRDQNYFSGAGRANKESHSRVVMRTVLRVERRCVQDVAVVGVRRIKAHKLAVESVNLFLGAGVEGEVMQTGVGLVVGGGLVAR